MNVNGYLLLSTKKRIFMKSHPITNRSKSLKYMLKNSYGLC